MYLNLKAFGFYMLLKILESLIKTIGFNDSVYELPKIQEIKPKHHTIRRDIKDRWKVGNDIHFFIKSRTKNKYRFAPVLKCKGIQKIEIQKNKDHVSVLIDDKLFYEQNSRFNVEFEPMNKLAINEGFDSEHDFFQYFNTDFVGKIIHWTELKY